MGKINLEKAKEVINNKEKYFNKEYLMENKKKVIKLLVVAVVILGLGTNVAMGYFDKGEDLDQLGKLEEIEMEQDAENLESMELIDQEDQAIIVDISGAVLTPMVVELPGGARINDAIKAAGGLTEKADLSQINRAQVLEDGQKIFIPIKTKGNKNQNGTSGNNGNSGGNGNDGNGSGNAGYISDNFGQDKVNLNSATSEKLQTLTGVGPATAEKIIRYREKKGSFKKIEDLKNVDGIGEKTFDKLKDYIVV